MLVADKYKYKLHFYCPSCGHTWLVGHHVVTLEEPCPLGFCSEDPIENHSYERSATHEPAGKAAKRSVKRAA
jgi:hypothetical protein